jgi:hypothetical protein
MRLIAFALLALIVVANGASVAEKFSSLLKLKNKAASKSASSGSCEGTDWACELVMVVGYSNGIGGGKASVNQGNDQEATSAEGDEDTIGSQILRSDDGGITWDTQTILGNSDDASASGVEEDSHDDGFALTGLSIGNGDLGEDANAQSAFVTVVGWDKNDDGKTCFWSSKDGGRTYERMEAQGLGKAGERAVVSCDDAGRFCVVAGDGIWVTMDGGNTFSDAGVADSVHVSKVWCGNADCTTGGFAGRADGNGVVFNFEISMGSDSSADGTVSLNPVYSVGESVEDVYSSHDHDEGVKVIASQGPDTITAINSDIMVAHTEIPNNNYPTCVHCIGQTCISSVYDNGGAYYISESGGMTWGKTVYTIEDGTGGNAVGTPFVDTIGVITTLFSSIAGDDGTDVWYFGTNDGGAYMSKDIYNTLTQIPASVYFDTVWVKGASSYFNGKE